MLPEFGIWPLEDGEFDVSEILAWARRDPTIVEVPSAQGARYERPNLPECVYVVCPTAKRAEAVKEWIQAGNTIEKFMASCGIVEATSEYISVYQLAPTEVVQKIANILLPFLHQNSWRIHSEDGDVTALYQENPEKLFD